MLGLKLNRVCKTHSCWLIDNEKLTANGSRLLWSPDTESGDILFHLNLQVGFGTDGNIYFDIINDNIAVCVPGNQNNVFY